MNPNPNPNPKPNPPDAARPGHISPYLPHISPISPQGEHHTGHGRLSQAATPCIPGEHHGPWALRRAVRAALPGLRARGGRRRPYNPNPNPNPLTLNPNPNPYPYPNPDPKPYPNLNLDQVAAVDATQAQFVVRLQLSRGDPWLFKELCARLLPAIRT